MTKTTLKTFVISVGIINIPTGKTGAFGTDNWSIYDNPKSNVYLTDRRSLLIASSNTFENGDIVSLIYNDTNRKVPGGEQTIISHCPCIKEDIIDWLFKNGFDYKPKKTFQASKFTKKLNTSFSVKGVE